MQKEKHFFEVNALKIKEIRNKIQEILDSDVIQSLKIKSDLIENFSDELINIFKYGIIMSKNKESVKFGMIFVNNDILKNEHGLFMIFVQTLILKSDFQWNLLFLNLDTDFDQIEIGRVIKLAAKTLTS